MSNLEWVLVGVGALALAAIEAVLRIRRRQAAREQEYLWDRTQSKIRERLNDPERIASLMQVRDRVGAQRAFLDNICRLTAVSLKAPKSVITMLDGEEQSWLAYHFEDPTTPIGPGVPDPHPLTASYCQFAVASDKTLAIENAKRDVLVKDNPCTTLLGMRAYLGSPVHSKEGFPVGSLCVFDYRKRKWSRRDITTIESLAALVSL